MENTSASGAPEQVVLQPDLTTKKKKGVQKPVFAKLFTKQPIQGGAAKVVHLMINPYSGKKMGEKVAEEAKAIMEKNSIKVHTYISTRSGELTELANALKANSSDIVAVIGGDGSLSEVITGLIKAGNNCRVGLIPAGTGNSMGYDLQIKTTEDAVARIIKGDYQKIDLSKVELVSGLPGSGGSEKLTLYSHNLVTWGLGVDSNIKSEKMRWMGSARYDVGIIMAILENRRRSATLTIDGHTMKDDYSMLLIQNNPTGGSELSLAPGASLDDGFMDCIMLKKMKRGELIKIFGQLKEDGRHVFNPKNNYHRFKTLEISTEEPTAINVDGENIGSTPLKMQVLVGALNLIYSSSSEGPEYNV
mmetsp:Transcript_10564/g.15547  ORF Transcript_10564/g.15547 Transcript_10564/m.15547 type:complete len:361 (-) Transcript_10564:976-2058(-)|eukprot:CAMPEP_0194200690 /NCGR_PEP_ID=MMETSP0156-20130528/1184_1 /TAXON_ID=33649 /ORGANISM="Thalassionema nitzschioides, Strain L26-B" /LENGTH=360 /DNA_ID=CAMNT_0038925721 /DNA_START=169 /DNA_END=1251 /DNA_ORIENTATION=+